MGLHKLLEYYHKSSCNFIYCFPIIYVLVLRARKKEEDEMCPSDIFIFSIQIILIFIGRIESVPAVRKGC